jgi:hypothetical protein
MLSQGPRTAWKVFPAVARAFGVSQSTRRYLGPLKGQVQLRQLWSTNSIVSQISRQSVFRVSLISVSRIENSAVRNLSTTRILLKQSATPKEDAVTELTKPNPAEEISLEFKRTEKGEAAKEVDLSARLKDRSSQNDKGEVIRLLRLASREWRALSGTSSPSYPMC